MPGTAGCTSQSIGFTAGALLGQCLVKGAAAVQAAATRAIARRSGTVVEFDRARDMAVDCPAALIATGNVMSVMLVRIAAGSAASLVTLFAGAAFAQEYRTALQISPQGGGNCIEVVNREIVRDQRMQMMPCNNSPAQTFIHDPATNHLTIGGFCIDVNGGQPGDLVRLWSCESGAKQAWKPEQKGSLHEVRRLERPVPRHPLRFEGGRGVGADLELRRCRAQPALEPAAEVRTRRPTVELKWGQFPRHGSLPEPPPQPSPASGRGSRKAVRSRELK